MIQCSLTDPRDQLTLDGNEDDANAEVASLYSIEPSIYYTPQASNATLTSASLTYEHSPVIEADEASVVRSVQASAATQI